MEYELQSLNHVLRQLRIKNGYSQAEIAEILGVSRSAYTYYETGTTEPSLTSIRRLSEIYGVPVTVFVYPEQFNCQ